MDGRRIGGAVAAIVMMATAPVASAATAARAPAGTLPDGTAIEAITLANAHGVTARILSFGATLQSVTMPDARGRMADVLLGYDDLAGYVEHPNFYGAIVGRVANRIAAGRFTLDGKAYQLARNDKGVGALHGGDRGFDKRAWRVVAIASGPVASVTLARRSPDGEEGYPGNLDVTVTYSLDESGDLAIDLAAKTDAPTIVNLTNHAIWNMAGEGAPQGALGERLTIPAAAITPVDAALIPTGALRPVAGTVFDFRAPRALDLGVRDGTDPQVALGHGYDHNFALDKGQTAAPQLAARLEDPASGRALDVLTTEPGVQLYTGNFLDGSVAGKHGHLYRMGDGVALEPQKFPDAVNHANFASVRIDPAHPYRHRMIFRLRTR